MDRSISIPPKEIISIPPKIAVPIYERTHKAKALVLFCIDYRFVNDSVFQIVKNYDHHFDLVSMAGAELFVVDNSRPSFKDTFFQNLDLAIELHHIHTFICISHSDCGAYISIYGDVPKHREREVHIQNILALKNLISQRHPTLKFKGYYQHLDGRLEKIV